MSSSSKPYFNISTIGQNGHGKTTLAAAITKTLATKSKTHGEINTRRRRKSTVDFPGHADYIKNVLGGAVQMDGAILVVSATEGPMPQTREQVRLARQAGVARIVVFLNKCDMVNDQQLGQVETKVRELLRTYDFPGNDVPIIRGSAQQALNGVGGELGERAIIRLGEALDAYIPEPEGALSDPFWMPVEETFPHSSRGMVATGRVERGVIRVGDQVEVVGVGTTTGTVCMGVEMFRRPVDMAEVGENVGVLLRGIKREDVERGCVLATPGTARWCADFKAEVYVLNMDEGGRATPFPNHYQPQFYFRRIDLKGSISFPRSRETVKPGDNLSITANLAVPIAMRKGQNFIIHEGGKVLGFGIVTSIIE
ncbi:elongation factor Tu [Aspergillus nomiae NRRL 13137]|uniref:Elongation factor Tu, mitochondrial n=1 Tax=Aspergillus nomiae NRRL (strain ATCC 15546 / NRRL 13137 / CBS 260.88 / M93) TaxID=1509407 RepID=A0A0L1ITD0_ASPN3|nr:elongation factor Tu [Aspergillus nomiae NRRL 13137]KNG82744.1 elongation factor Tu [Aspergillus nomiae NRRL 13137]